MTRVVVVSAGTRPGCLTDRLATCLGSEVLRSLSEFRTGQRSDEIDEEDFWSLAEHGPAVAAGLLSCTPDRRLFPLIDSLAQADVLVAVSPVHNASYSALFKAFFDQLPRGTIAGVPTVSGTSGGSPRQGMVSDLVVRPYLSTLRALVVPTVVDVHRGDWLPHGMPRPEISHRIRRAAGEAAALTASSGQATVETVA
ncbi:NAD(P)H-dependent oxidoreductase [Austwickia chelonae]|uniref:NAD(P)H-dependent oxidoreductase n=1 Tax=Austwickia chelonae TaxID=100225 RepID=UPI000E266DEB|nr:NAD(P)H-dependent oxidoreductase [Austwickia chelonae]